MNNNLKYLDLVLYIILECLPLMLFQVNYILGVPLTLKECISMSFQNCGFVPLDL